MTEQADEQPSLLKLTAQIVAAYVGKNQVQPAEVSDLIVSVVNSLTEANAPRPEPVADELPMPAVPVRKSVTADYIVCLEDGKKFKSLKRHLRTHYEMTPQEYREKWKLPADYPMIAPNYAIARSRLAKSLGLGSKRRRSTAIEASSTP